MAECSLCNPTLSLTANCAHKVAGGFETTIYFIPMCELENDPFQSYQGTTSIVDDILVKSGKFFRSIKVRKDSASLVPTRNSTTRMINEVLTFTVDKLGSDTDRVIAASEVIDFMNAMNDNDEPLCFILETRRNSKNQTLREIVPSMYPGEFTGTSGAALEETPGHVLVFNGSLEQYPFALDDAYEIPTA